MSNLKNEPASVCAAAQSGMGGSPMRNPAPLTPRTSTLPTSGMERGRPARPLQVAISASDNPPAANPASAAQGMGEPPMPLPSAQNTGGTPVPLPTPMPLPPPPAPTHHSPLPPVPTAAIETATAKLVEVFTSALSTVRAADAATVSATLAAVSSENETLRGEISALSKALEEAEVKAAQASKAALAAVKERDSIITSAARDRDAALAAAKSEKDAALAAISAEKNAAIATLTAERDTIAANAKAERDSALAAERAHATATLAAERAAAAATLSTERAAAAATLEKVRNENAAEIAQLKRKTETIQKKLDDTQVTTAESVRKEEILNNLFLGLEEAAQEPGIAVAAREQLFNDFDKVLAARQILGDLLILQAEVIANPEAPAVLGNLKSLCKNLPRYCEDGEHYDNGTRNAWEDILRIYTQNQYTIRAAMPGDPVNPTFMSAPPNTSKVRAVERWAILKGGQILQKALVV